MSAESKALVAAVSTGLQSMVDSHYEPRACTDALHAMAGDPPTRTRVIAMSATMSIIIGQHMRVLLDIPDDDHLALVPMRMDTKSGEVSMESLPDDLSTLPRGVHAAITASRALAAGANGDPRDVLALYEAAADAGEDVLAAVNVQTIQALHAFEHEMGHPFVFVRE